MSWLDIATTNIFISKLAAIIVIIILVIDLNYFSR